MKRYIIKLVDGKEATTIQKWKLKKDKYVSQISYSIIEELNTFFQISTYIIGRSDKVEIPIQQESISRKHAEICVLENSATIKDLGSANGTFIDDKIAKHNQIIFLKNGTKIYLGDSPNYLIVKEKERKAKVSEQSLQEEEEVQEQQTNEQKKMKIKKESKQRDSEDEEEEVEQKKDQKKKKGTKEQQEDRKRSRSYEKEKQKSSKNEQKEFQTQEQKPNASVKDLNASDKRKLLWQNKKTDNLESKAQIYGKVEANAEETNKFFKLLGFKSSADGKSSTGAKVQNYFITKSGSDKQTMINDLESQYNEGMKRKNGNKGGLGYN